MVEDTTTHTAELAHAREQISGLQIALRSCRRIGIAVGILMAIHRVTDDSAADMLKKFSQEHNVKVRDLAETVILTGDLPG